MTIQGKDSLFYIYYNDVWFPVACLTSSPFSEDVEMMPTTTRDSAGWKTAKPTMQSYSIELNGLLTKDDADSGNNVISYPKLREFKRNRIKIEWKIETEGGYYIDSGFAYITSINKTDDVGEMIGFTASLQGYGAPSESNNKVYVLGEPDKNTVYGENNNLIETK